jgi:hypothetical protein
MIVHRLIDGGRGLHGGVHGRCRLCDRSDHKPGDGQDGQQMTYGGQKLHQRKETCADSSIDAAQYKAFPGGFKGEAH